MEYCIRYIDLPYSVHGMTILDEDGFYNVYINARMDDEHRAQAVRHELKHIARDDFFSDKSLEEVETM